MSQKDDKERTEQRLMSGCFGLVFGVAALAATTSASGRATPLAWAVSVIVSLATFRLILLLCTLPQFNKPNKRFIEAKRARAVSDAEKKKAAMLSAINACQRSGGHSWSFAGDERWRYSAGGPIDDDLPAPVYYVYWTCRRCGGLAETMDLATPPAALEARVHDGSFVNSLRGGHEFRWRP
jgi:hypothetical protein